MKAVFASAAMVLTLAVPAYAQSKEPKAPTLEQMMDAKTPDQVEKERQADKAYRESLKKIPDAKAPSDPWGSARGADAVKTRTSSAAVKKPTVKSGTSAK